MPTPMPPRAHTGAVTTPDANESVVVVGHDASRTGAPILLESALRWATSQPEFGGELSLILRAGGPLVDDYRAILPTLVLGRGVTAPLERLGSAARSVGLPEGPDVVALVARRAMRASRAGVVVANTVVSLPLAAKLASHRARLVCHVHELDGVVGRVLPDGARRSALLNRVDRFIAAGPPVAEMLVDRWDVASTRVVVVDEWIDVTDSTDRHAPTDPSAPTGHDTTADRSTHSRPRVLAVGALRHRKGSARFVDLMSLLASHPTRPRGTWVGGEASSVEASEMRADIARAVDPDSLELIADRADPSEVITSADVFVSTATEDPYPLTVLEAAAAGVPVAGFDSGGIREVLHAVGQDDALVGVDDVIGLARIVGRLLDDPGERVRRGRDLSDWVRRTHTSAQLAPRWWDAVTG